MSWPWLTADSSEQALWNYTLIPAWIYSGVCIFFLFWLSIVFFLSDPLSLSLIFVYWSPNTSFLEVSIYFSHSLSCSCWLSHHFYLYLLPLSLSLIFFSVAFFFFFQTFSLTPNTHFASSVSCSALIQVEWTYCPFSNLLEMMLFLFPTYAAATKSLQLCPTLCDPIDGSSPGSPVPGFSKQEHWSGLPFPSPMHESEKWKWSRSVVSDS